MKLNPTPEQRAEMAAYIDAKEPGLLDDLGIAQVNDPDTERGLYGKYRVEKVNGKPVGECFVLEQHDPHAIAALRAYADSCAGNFDSLAFDLWAMSDRWEQLRGPSK
jgi:hypothetical protein